ncbi:uncharacterized protein DUF4271 [Lutibacter sp. Hel_I_33_5]|uniref:DUF4271 domain-containing protein n=1 Tax=Lutibacter sp. Hel_I_33_5 TaxID=1566289 RepID=UPI0011A82BCA|nr:uncharacterized protein DUF4271 [Lutibacter sp. Hel_I_33_5]
MDGLERVFFSNNLVSSVLVFLLVLIGVLKGLNSVKLNGYSFIFFNKGFLELEAEENTSPFSFYNGVLFLFTTITFSLLFSLFFDKSQLNFSSFLTVFVAVTSYFLVRWLLEFLLSFLFEIQPISHFFLFTKASFLHSFSFLTFIFLIINSYIFNDITIVKGFLLIFILIRYLFLFIYNKKLILSKLFYFILYLCAFEIAPLLVLFKSIF